MSWTTRLTLSACCLAACCLTVACTKVELKKLPDPPPPPIDNRASVSGRFCTADPQAVEFPVKVLFVVDTSGSMAITDPPNPADANYTGRTRAVIDVINSLAGQTGVEIGIITFHSSINDLTRGFRPNFTAADVALLTQAAANLGSNAAQTNYGGALEAAFQVLFDDMTAADELTRARSKYTVIFLSDGLPNPPVPSDELLGLVEDIQDLERERRLVELKLHTAYVSGTTPPRFQQAPINLLREMADTGAGTFRNFSNGERINFLDIGFTSFRRTFALKSFIVQNVNARPLVDIGAAMDSDADGLTDEDELRIGTDPARLDTDGDGFSDRLEDRLGNAGFDPLDGLDADCAVTPNDDFNRRDDDGDGLLNCEERFLGTNQRLFDTDADGLGDRFEILARLSAVDDDFFGDLDRDGIVNGYEVRDRTDPRIDDREDFFDLRYRYDVREVELRGSQTCYEFFVDNIQLVSSAPSEGGLEGVNNVMVVLGQSPADDPEDFGEFSIACARYRYVLSLDEKLPADGHIELTEADFKRPANPLDPTDVSVFDPERDCVGP